MSVVINGTTIRMTRGDTLKVIVGIKNPDGSDYTPIEGDSIRFAVKEYYLQSTPVIVKEIPTDTMLLWLEPSDTKSLKMPREYVYDIELTHANGDVDTFIANAELNITEEVH